jgi:probable phosphomutase (TIGR03848 family)
MSATFLLIRHAQTDFTGTTILGRRPGVALNAVGREQARLLAHRLEPLSLGAVYSSPVQRAMETAAPIAESRRLQVQRADAFAELEFGDWTGRQIGDLEGDPAWTRFNHYRSGTRIPNGESTLSVVARATDQLEQWRRAHQNQTIAIVSHGDVIRYALSYFLGAPLDLFLRLEVSPASVSVVKLEEFGPRILRMNDTGADWLL